MVDLQNLQEWYNTLYPRTVDLVGDYAGDERFILEGDSLLLHCFSSNQVDFDTGFQLLHATYTVERLLLQLHQRNCNFHVVFFQDHAHGCIPPGVPQRLWPRYRLAREAILQHLSHNLPSAVPSMKVQCFDTYRSKEFGKYLVAVGAYFLMCHDGAFSELQAQSHPLTIEDLELSSDEDSDVGEPVRETTYIWETSSMFRLMIHHFVHRGYNVALINSLEYRDTKAMAMVVEGAQPARRLYNAGGSTLEDVSSSASKQYPVTRIHEAHRSAMEREMQSMIPASVPPIVDRAMYEKLSESLLEAINKQPSLLTQRESLSILALGAMFQSEGVEGSDNNNILAARSILLHTVILGDCSLGQRATGPRTIRMDESFLRNYTQSLFDILSSTWWQAFATGLHCDLADLVDGRVLHETEAMLRRPNFLKDLARSTRSRFDTLASLFKELCGVNIGLKPIGGSEHGLTTKGCNNKKKLVSQGNISNAVLPFTNPILDPHLRPVSLTIDASAGKIADLAMSRISEELSHWHNHRNRLDKKSVTPLTYWQLRRNQWFMAEIQQYAASLTNSAGGILQPETVVQKSEIGSQRKRIQGPPPESREARRGHPTKKDIRSRTGPISVRDQVAAHQEAKRNETTNKHFQALKVKLAALDKETDYVARYVKVKQYLSSLSGDKKDLLEPEVMVYGLSTLIQIWRDRCSSNQRDQSMSVAALIWNTVCEIAKKKDGITEEIATCVQDATRNLNLPIVDISPSGKRPLSFQFATMNSTKVDLVVGLSPLEFQLVQAGPYLDRSMGSAPDPRVHDFEPDRWQREILDEIDARKSLFVVAPTSAGKTFISFYAIKQILEDDSDGVLVYVAPTKALVNQIAAEVQARFSKRFKHEGKSVWAIHTRDYRINNPTGCQVLITVPHILQIMLLAPGHANSWSPLVKRIIFDEIHCIGQAEDGVIWEQLLLLAPCPIIALSATVGNPKEFGDWLESTQRVNGNELKTIEHGSRYSDLRKYVYHPPSSFVFNGLSSPVLLPPLGLDASPNMSFMHPVASLIDRSRGIPNDLTLEPRDCWTLWNAMKRNKTEQFPVDRSLDPSVALPATIRKADIVGWERKLKTLLKTWMNDDQSPFDAVLKELSPTPHPSTQSDFQVSSGKPGKSDTTHEVQRNSILDTTLPLICSLHDQGALPALIFNYDRSYCEKISLYLLEQLEVAERRWKDSSPVWANKIAEWKAWQQVEQNRERTHKKKEASQGRKMSKEEQMLELASTEANKYSSFDPNSPVPGFHLADTKKLLLSEFEEYEADLKRRLVPGRFIDALKRGIGVHHAGMNRRYRQVCEILFRKGYLRVVVATGTLALGINMPCKTVIFSGDSVFLTALGFRQAAGRAGRRGFDFLGNVVFQAVPYTKVCRLLSSKLPSLNGHFPITTSLVLRLLILLHESKQAPYAVKAINSILSCPRIYLGGPESKQTVLHHLRFSIEYLRRNYLLSQTGAPLNFSSTVSHLYYTGNASFAFHALLGGGYFHDLCRDIHHNPKQVLLDLMLVMAHLFGRHSLRPAILESMHAAPKSSSSVIILPPMPDNAARILRSHNDQTLSIFSAYVSTYIQQHIESPESALPLTNLKCGGDRSLTEIHPAMSFHPPTHITSAFVALSGHRDKWTSISQLCENVRSGVWLEQAVVPYVGLFPEEGKLPLNAYLFDFFKHGNIHALEKDNMIRKGDLWFVLNDFSMILATIVTSFENFFKLSPTAELDMLDVMGGGEAHNEELHLDFQEVPSLAEPASQPPPRPIKARKPKVVESWEDDVSDEESEDVESLHAVLNDSKRKKTESGIETQVDAVLDAQRMLQVLTAFRMLQGEFNEKFKAMWA